MEDNKKLFDILITSLWGGAKQNTDISASIRQELQAQTVEGLTAEAYPDPGALKYRQAARFVWMAEAQVEAVRLIQDANIPVAVIKGTASGIYYPAPYLRTYGDIDLLVHPEHYARAICALKDGEWVQEGDVGRFHTALNKNGFLVELHQCPPGLDEVPEGEYIHQYLLSGLKDIQPGLIRQPNCSFPMLPWKQNGLELIWHFREHLYNGIGLRHAIDWMMFVHGCLDDEAFLEYEPVLRKAGLLALAKAVARMCQLYLGLDEGIAWCRDVDDALCADLMDFIIEQGNFGHKRIDDKAAKVMTRYRTPFHFFKGMQQKGLYSWKAAREHTVLRPFAWVYVAVQGSRHYLTSGGLGQLRRDWREKKQREEMLDRLYGKRLVSKEISVPHVQTVRVSDRKPERSALSSFKQRLWPAYRRVRKSVLRRPLYHIQNAYFACRHACFGRPHISPADRENVGKNVTFIYKSFNRQKKAAKLYRCIKAYYPSARVVIADDSREPLCISGMAEGDMIVRLPFNSGLSRGLIAALEQVRTPYVMRMDDDLLLIPKSDIHGQLAFLQKHSEVDLAAVQMTNRWPKIRAAEYRKIRMNKRLIIPAGMMIEGREVVYKAPNVFLARTESLKKVGYDPNIRMIDHHEFFLRAAGQIVCVQDAHRFVMHCHNLFESEDYADYRNDVAGDVRYIEEKHVGGR